MDMDMDVAWCLTCSKRTGDPRQPYCSEACRLQDTQPPPSSSVTSPMPHYSMASAHTAEQFSIPTVRLTSPVKRRLHRPPLAAVPLTSLSIDLTGHKLGTRDRRTFSFPAPQAIASIVPMTRREARQSSNVLPPFTRKPASTSISALSPYLPVTREYLRAPGAVKLSKLTGGANTPLDEDAVFCFTSESSDNAGAEPIIPCTSVPLKVQRPPFTTKQSSSVMSSFATKQSQFSPRKSAQSPVAALVASSASSRSREDIISWARAVDSRPGQRNLDTGEEAHPDVKRGRSRTRRFETLAHIDPPRQEQIDDLDEAQGAAGTTPEGRIESAVAGLSIGGFGVVPIVKALAHAATLPTAPEKQPVGLGLQAIPSAAEVSRVAVNASTTTAENDPQAKYFNPGTTPTLSTVSFSEAMEPSVVTDNQENIDMVTDDQSTSSYFALRRASSSAKTRPPPPQYQQLPRPLRPIATTATAIWNISTYLSSFSPFSMPSIVNNRGRAAAVPAKVNTAGKRESPVKPPVTATAAPMPEGRADAPGQPPKQAMVRSLPMDILVPVGGAGRTEDRARVRDMRGSIGRSPTRSGSRSRRRLISPSPSPIQDEQAEGRSHSRKWSYDADAIDDNGEEQQRGRSRRNKALNREAPRQLSTVATHTSADSSESRGRGRKRTARAQ